MKVSDREIETRTEILLPRRKQKTGRPDDSNLNQKLRLREEKAHFHYSNLFLEPEEPLFGFLLLTANDLTQIKLRALIQL